MVFLQATSGEQAMALAAAWRQHNSSRAAAKAAAALQSEVGQKFQTHCQARDAMQSALSEDAALGELHDVACLVCASASSANFKQERALW